MYGTFLSAKKVTSAEVLLLEYAFADFDSDIEIMGIRIAVSGFLLAEKAYTLVKTSLSGLKLIFMNFAENDFPAR